MQNTSTRKCPWCEPVPADESSGICQTHYDVLAVQIAQRWWAERCQEAMRAVEAPTSSEGRARWFAEQLKGGTCDL